MGILAQNNKAIYATKDDSQYELYGKMLMEEKMWGEI